MKIERRKWVQAVGADAAPVLLTLLEAGGVAFDPVENRVNPVYREYTDELSEEDFRKVLAVLSQANPQFLPKADYEKVENDFKRRTDKQWQLEQARLAEQRRQTQAATEQRLLKAGLDALGGSGTTWAARAAEIEAWWNGVKRREAAETWESVFTGNRMTARQVNAKGRGGTFTIVNRHDRKDAAKERELYLDRGLGGILARVTPANFFSGPGSANRKYELGLHDLSGTLLTSARPVLKQLKPYDEAVVVFTPAPAETDAQVFAAISELEKPDADKLREYRSKFTRLRLAQSSDMGSVFVDDNTDPKAELRARYGINGRVLLPGGAIIAIDETMLAKRRTDALEHSTILSGDAKALVNEVVIVYRQHAATDLFPLFARWDRETTSYRVLNRTTSAPTGAWISDAGAWHPA
ncbi:hypothetical protein [Nocardia sp. NRRL S-836]|uniref:hypothetical protein n=1 Tax=Nocardia sp. NRRL S-836 TaxID=1519492 RepID=UPI0006AECB5F|nr:hypothetical protein [Nocardia sp. NRRL S-836]KOV79762.1 hypothetical protein ADL03_36005 [Nocardia sp. NRRL S-836]